MKCIICNQEHTEKWYYNVCRNCSTSGGEYKHNPTLTKTDYRYEEDKDKFLTNQLKDK